MWTGKGVKSGIMDPADALNLLARSLEGRSKNVAHNIREARRFIGHGDFQRALQHTSKACVIDENNLEARFIKGFCLWKMGDLHQAVDVYKRIIEQVRTNSVAHFFLAECCRDAHRIEEAIEYYRQAIRLDSDGDVREMAERSILALKESL